MHFPLVDAFISSEPPVFFELRVRYLLSSARVSEAMALAKCCAQHPATGQHIFFLQFYLTWLHKTSQHDRLHEEVGSVTLCGRLSVRQSQCVSSVNCSSCLVITYTTVVSVGNISGPN